MKESKAKILSLQLYTKLEHRAPVFPDGKFEMEICSQALHRWPVHKQKAQHIRTLLCTQTPGGSSDWAAWCLAILYKWPDSSFSTWVSFIENRRCPWEPAWIVKHLPKCMHLEAYNADLLYCVELVGINHWHNCIWLQKNPQEAGQGKLLQMTFHPWGLDLKTCSE